MISVVGVPAAITHRKGATAGAFDVGAPPAGYMEGAIEAGERAAAEVLAALAA